MNNFRSIDDILDFAIQSEQNAVDFYLGLAERLKNEEMKKIFRDFAAEEVKHKMNLKRVKEEKIFKVPNEKILDLKISDYIDSVVISPDMDYQQALVVAMNREKAAFNLYTRLSEKTDMPDLKNLFLSLAQEESKHKLRFEMEYDDYIAREN